MNLDYTSTALLFPAIPLMLIAFGTRFTVVASLIRKIHDDYTQNKDKKDNIAKTILEEISTLRKRLIIIQINQSLVSISFFFNVLTMFSLYMQKENIALIIFGITLIALMIAILLFIIEIGMATISLNLHLKNLGKKK